LIVACKAGPLSAHAAPGKIKHNPKITINAKDKKGKNNALGATQRKRHYKAKKPEGHVIFYPPVSFFCLGAALTRQIS
jgi:hypothetical protein